MTWRLAMEWVCDYNGCSTTEYTQVQNATPVPPSGWTTISLGRHWCGTHEAPTSGSVPYGLAVGIGQPGVEPA